MGRKAKIILRLTAFVGRPEGERSVGALDAVLKVLLPPSRIVDATTTWIGKRLAWLILAAVVVSALNASVRKIFDTSSNSWLELQWVLFSIVFLLCSPWTLLANEHIRIDIVNNLLPKWLHNTIDLIGHAFFLLPLTIVLIITGYPFFINSASIRRAILEHRGPAAMAGEVTDHDWLCHAVHSGPLRTGQACRGDARSHPRSARGPEKLAGDRSRGINRRDRKALTVGWEARSAHGSVSHPQHGADHVRFACGRASARLSGGVLTRRSWFDFRAGWHRVRPFRTRLPASSARARLWRHEQRYVAGHPILHIHGPGT